MPQSIYGSLLVIISALGFSVMPFFAISAYAHGMNVPTLLFLRFSLAAALLFASIAMRRQMSRPSAKQLGALLVLGGIFYALQSTCYFTAVKYISPGLASLVLYTYPVLVALLSMAVERESLTIKLLLSLGASVAGVALIVGVSGAAHPAGIALAFAAAAVYSGYIVMSNRLLKSLPPLNATAFICLFAALSFYITGSMSGELDLKIASAAWPAVAGLAVFATALAMLAFFLGLDMLGSTRAAILSTMEPLATAALSALLLHQALSPWQLAGGMAILSGAVLVALPPRVARGVQC